jgi:hypothetical protein
MATYSFVIHIDPDAVGQAIFKGLANHVQLTDSLITLGTLGEVSHWFTTHRVEEYPEAIFCDVSYVHRDSLKILNYLQRMKKGIEKAYSVYTLAHSQFESHTAQRHPVSTNCLTYPLNIGKLKGLISHIEAERGHSKQTKSP